MPSADPAELPVLVPGPPVHGRCFTAPARRVRMSDAAVSGRMRLDGVARFLQDVANDDSRDAGSPDPTAWVARRTVVVARTLPRYLDLVESSTWCSGLGPKWAERRYSMVGAGVDVEAATLWVRVDMATMRPLSLPPGFERDFGAAAGGRRVSARQLLPTSPGPEWPRRVREWQIRRTDLDVLGHVNNAVYWSIAEEVLGEIGTWRAPLSVSLEHHTAIEFGSTVTVTVAPLDGTDEVNGVDVWVRAAADGADTLAAAIRIQPGVAASAG